MQNIRSYNKIIREMGTGEKIDINAINLSMAMIDQLRSDIQNGILVPDEAELTSIIKPEAIDKFRSGQSIAPQMTYIKR